MGIMIPSVPSAPSRPSKPTILTPGMARSAMKKSSNVSWAAWTAWGQRGAGGGGREAARGRGMERTGWRERKGSLCKCRMIGGSRKRSVPRAGQEACAGGAQGERSTALVLGSFGLQTTHRPSHPASKIPHGYPEQPRTARLPRPHLPHAPPPSPTWLVMMSPMPSSIS